ncbi:MAG: thiopurine S-methyltransferase [gamma proteobacterium symbiont of Bathyaustriella thionipta]|nr:thiopurine S-methyltransferase [gamma proteobacterium symbiont of Bathyaustriella thionipta]MCU7950706.1 thiopurine S-methyltransferase [gamma proteobacterium symbiont of Bathyaustriella thionipta]MCU7954298.1 thiopurine S-methyltransferase [gamma proteobacterium symbiont of Bathyaustriella thionipta]MCU7956728.1 thiopurine S-methyltransferase [gamma proteobacterium symbiont of Bathyaustriella thionipta]MCU7968738.1 thiopurine S-methyltransferase [gamma proteobacterium symbiont of Bathyaustr
MHHSFWHQRWQEQRIGFHLDKVNPYLSKYWHRLEVLEQGCVFVPLCGKSHDLLFFHQQGQKVLGNELSSLAVQDFYTEQRLNASKTIISSKNNSSNETELIRWSSPQVDILCGDFFALEKDYLSDITIVYDRAALVALPSDMRQFYVKKLLQILPEKIKILLLTLDYDENEKQGPPFSVTEEEVYQLYGKNFSIELLEVTDIAAEQRSPRSQNMSYFNERVFLLERV